MREVHRLVVLARRDLRAIVVSMIIRGIFILDERARTCVKSASRLRYCRLPYWLIERFYEVWHSLFYVG